MSATASVPITASDRMGLLAWAALLTLQLTWYAWLAPSRTLPPAMALGLAIVPLLVPLLALRRPRRALLWVGMLALFYFCHGVAEAWSAPSTRTLAWLEILLSLLLIGSLGAGVRTRK
ncbi:MAG: DUF2069 domain-containing protein [Dyella sp.]